MMSYLKGLILGGPKAEEEDDVVRLVDDDITKVLKPEDIEDIIAAGLPSPVTLYEVRAKKQGTLQQARHAV